MGKIINNLSNNIKKNFGLFILGVVIYLVSIIIGFLFKTENLIHLYNEFILNFFNKALSPSVLAVSFLLKRLLNTILLFLPIFLLCLNRYTFYLIFIIVFYKGLVLALALKCVISAIGFGGIVLFIFLVLLQNVFVCFSLILLIINLNCLYSSNNKLQLNCILNYIFISIIICFFVSIIEFLLLICVLRPFNFYF